MADARRFAPATARNRGPILDVLRRHVAPGSQVLEIASGSGEHAVYLSAELAVASWQPSDRDRDARASIDAWRDFMGHTNVLPAIDLDVGASWPEVRVDAVVCINMIHIAPWTACIALLEGAAKTLRTGGLLYLYGPYRRESRHTAPSNATFDAHLRQQNPEWGVRDLEEVIANAIERRFSLVDVVDMPANNLSVLLSSNA